VSHNVEPCGTLLGMTASCSVGEGEGPDVG
jgi:hypothetical protein